MIAKRSRKPPVSRTISYLGRKAAKAACLHRRERKRKLLVAIIFLAPAPRLIPVRRRLWNWNLQKAPCGHICWRVDLWKTSEVITPLPPGDRVPIETMVHAGGRPDEFRSPRH